MDHRKIDPAEGGMSRNLQTVLLLIGLALSVISTGVILIFEFNEFKGEIDEGFRQHALVIDRNHADLLAKSDSDFRALLRTGENDRRELFGIIEDRRIETDEKLDDQREELYQIKLDIQVRPNTP